MHPSGLAATTATPTTLEGIGDAEGTRLVVESLCDLGLVGRGQL